MRGLSLVGTIFTSKNHGDFEVIEYTDYDNVMVKFVDTGYTGKTSLYHIKEGVVKDRLSPSVYGVGVLGDAKTRNNGTTCLEYVFWRGMLNRCYNQKAQHKNTTYTKCIVSENFKNYTYFKEWCADQVGFGKLNWELDKDIILKGNKVYSEDACAFVPAEVNLLLCNSKVIRGEFPVGVRKTKGSKFKSCLTKYGKQVHLGTFNSCDEAFQAYKEAKEDHIKVVAERWRDQIDHRVYNALINWSVSIDD